MKEKIKLWTIYGLAGLSSAIAVPTFYEGHNRFSEFNKLVEKADLNGNGKLDQEEKIKVYQDLGISNFAVHPLDGLTSTQMKEYNSKH
jgi:hypothetical protein